MSILERARLVLALSLIVALHGVAAADIAVGSTREDVIAQLGNPQSSMVAGPREMMTYADRKVILVDGRVDRIEGQDAPEAQGGPAPAAGQPAALQPTALAAARAGFVTHLIRQERSGKEPAAPPADLSLVTYTSPLGPMSAYLSRSPGDGRRHPAIVWLTGDRSNSIGPLVFHPTVPFNDQSATGFRSAKIVTLYPSMRGGNTNPGFNEGCYGEVDDVLAAARFLAELPDVNPDRIYLGGFNEGGTLALLVAESGGSFRAVFSLGPVEDMRGYGPARLPFDPSDPTEVRLRAPMLWLSAIRSPTYVFEGTKPPNLMQALQILKSVNSNPRVHMEPIPGYDHFSMIVPIVRQLSWQILNDRPDVPEFTPTRPPGTPAPGGPHAG